jgi:thioredoxin-like negative regulator of GroEL
VAWFWTDDLARLLIEAGTSERALSELLSRPAAVAASDEMEALEVAKRLAGLDPAESDAA